jgi:hypothetical protein
VRAHLTASYRKVRAVFAHPAVRMTRTFVRRVVTTCAVIIAVVIVTTLTIDLGPSAKSYAETYGSKYLERPLHIGRLSFRLFTGRFVIEDLEIEGVTPESPPFLTARRIDVAVPWSTLIDRRVVLDSIEMIDWRMHLEVLKTGQHSLPRLMPRGTSEGKRTWTTTLKWVRAHRGEFTFRDHGTDWGIVTRNLDVTVARPGDEYRGQARFSNGTVSIQDYLPFAAEMTSTFKIDGSRVVFDRIDLVSDGARSIINGDVNLKHFPEMMYRVESTIDFERMRQIFFARENFRLSGTGRFSGHFHVFKQPRTDGRSGTGRELFGTFESPMAGVGDQRFANLRGSVRWTPRRLAVTEASAQIYGGRARFGYEMSPLGVRGVRANARLDATLDGLSLVQLTEYLKLEGMRLSGNLSGGVRLEWPLGRFAAERRFSGDVRVTPPPGATLMTESLPVELIEQNRLPRAPAAPLAPLIPIPIGGNLVFALEPGKVRISPSSVATLRTFVRFEGDTTTAGEESTIPFVVSSADWQESYSVFASMMTALGVRTTTVDVNGYGTVDGVLTGSLKRPRIEGTFAAERMRVWDVDWGSVRGRALIEGGYATLAETTVTSGSSTITTDGRFALGSAGRDGDEINATVVVKDRPLSDLKHAFQLDRAPIDGVLSGEFHVIGRYRAPHGYGTMKIASATAWGEPFDAMSATVGLEGRGVRLTEIELAKGEGRGSGAAYVDWEADIYSFDFASTVPIPVESIELLRGRMPEELPLSGLIDFRADGSGSFDKPRFTVSGSIRDLFVADEGVGQVNVSTLVFEDSMLRLDAKVASARLDVGIVGTVDLNDAATADLRFTINDTSLDPYLRAFDPRLSPYTTAVVSGTVGVRGDLTASPKDLEIRAHVSKLDLRLFDYQLQNAGEFDIEFDRNVVRIPKEKPLGLFGDDTKLTIQGEIGLGDETLEMTVDGFANLAVLQGFNPNLRSSGSASLSATLTGEIREPRASGTLQIQNGRIRHFGLPLALERINGPIGFTDTGITLDELTGELGGGRVQFEGSIENEGYLPGQINLTMFSIGPQGVNVRYPEGMRSEVMIDRLTLRGRFDDLRLDGEVRVRDALYAKPFPNSLVAFVTSGSSVEVPSESGLTLPLTFDGLLIRAESSIRVENSGEFSARVRSSANLELRGTIDQPVLAGEMELDRGGEFTLFGKRYTITQGTVYFDNPTKIEPSFDVEAETRVRVPGETYRITTNLTGVCCAALRPTFSSDPPLSNSEVIALLVSDVPPAQDTELRRARGDSRTQEQLLSELAAREVTSVFSSQVNQTIERTLGVGFSLTPTLFDPNLQSSRAEPGARVIISRRVTPQLFLTYSRNLSTSTHDEIIVLEYEASDRMTWILSRNEDQTYAIEVRMRRTF